MNRNLSETEEVGVRTLLQMMTLEDLLSLTFTTTKGFVKPENQEDAINAIIMYCDKPSILLRRKKIKRELLFQYLRESGVIVSINGDKRDLIDACLKFWGSVDAVREEFESKPLVRPGLRETQPNIKREPTDVKPNIKHPIQKHHVEVEPPHPRPHYVEPQPQQHIHVEPQPQQHIHVEPKPQQHIHVERQPQQHIHVEPQPQQHIHVEPQPQQHIHVEPQPQQHIHVEPQPQQHIHVEPQPQQHIHVEPQPQQHIHVEPQPQQHIHVEPQPQQHIHVEPQQQPHIEPQPQQHIHVEPQQRHPEVPNQNIIHGNGIPFVEEPQAPFIQQQNPGSSVQITEVFEQPNALNNNIVPYNTTQSQPIIHPIIVSQPAPVINIENTVYNSTQGQHPSVNNEFNEYNIVVNESPPCEKIRELGNCFVNWFYKTLNGNEPHFPVHSLEVDNFWPDCSIEVYTEGNDRNSKSACIQGACNILLFFKHVLNDNRLYMVPALESIQTNYNSHGVVKVTVNGIMHQMPISAGLFEHVFILIKDPVNPNDVWKIKNTMLRMRLNCPLNNFLQSQQALMNIAFN